MNARTADEPGDTKAGETGAREAEAGEAGAGSVGNAEAGKAEADDGKAEAEEARTAEAGSGTGTGSGSGTALGATRGERSGRATGIAVAGADGGASPPAAPDAVPAGRPGKPMLAVAAIAGAVLIAVPLLLMGGGKDDKGNGPSGSVALQTSDTVLGSDALAGAPGDYASEKPSASPTATPSKSARVEIPQVRHDPEPKESKESVKDKPSPTADSKKDKKEKAADEKPKAVVWTKTTVAAPSKLETGQSWSTNRIRMTIQPDGNFVVYNKADNHALWASMVFGENHNVEFQPDGNLVVYTADHKAVWASRTNGNDGAKLVLREDGRVSITTGDKVLWST
ncbi:mannose-binding protein [Streptomyces sp. NPDC088400]|uniref:mannose-binding protein n=1 Tax=Streptomyces sp. NPDC088400 TaxID=3365861 RepID=UPI0038202E61